MIAGAQTPFGPNTGRPPANRIINGGRRRCVCARRRPLSAGRHWQRLRADSSVKILCLTSGLCGVNALRNNAQSDIICHLLTLAYKRALELGPAHGRKSSISVPDPIRSSGRIGSEPSGRSAGWQTIRAAAELGAILHAGDGRSCATSGASRLPVGRRTRRHYQSLYAFLCVFACVLARPLLCDN
jgi:hypothetical protein